jgi:hydroxymethylpyrimidine kinase / phosphomethylpyrimidine kinase / thiamine-phosphate diphosphorylase
MTNSTMLNNTPIIASFAASCASGLAGLQADNATALALGVHCTNIVTAVTAQSDTQSSRCEPVASDLIDEQARLLWQDMPPAAIKVGVIGSLDGIVTVGQHLANSDLPVICDPVVAASTGLVFIKPEWRDHYVEKILPHVTVLTPNLDEVAFFTGITCREDADYVNAAEWFLARGVQSVLIKGGHATSEIARDCWHDGNDPAWIASPRQSGTLRGSGCRLSTAIAAECAKGQLLVDALVLAKHFVNQQFYSNSKPIQYDEMPQVTYINTPLTLGQDFIPEKELGLYAIVDNTDFLKRLAEHGVKTFQLRMKDGEDECIRQEIQTAVKLAKQFDLTLYINDYWQWAIEFGAHGVHLGQEDVRVADLAAIRAAGLRLGISCHNHWEVACARAVDPSYVAIGPIKPTTTKDMPHKPIGIENVAYWRALLGDKPMVVIGGIGLDEVDRLEALGADGVAMISALDGLVQDASIE